MGDKVPGKDRANPQGTQIKSGAEGDVRLDTYGEGETTGNPWDSSHIDCDLTERVTSIME